MSSDEKDPVETETIETHEEPTSAPATEETPPRVPEVFKERAIFSSIDTICALIRDIEGFEDNDSILNEVNYEGSGIQELRRIRQGAKQEAAVAADAARQAVLDVKDVLEPALEAVNDRRTQLKETVEIIRKVTESLKRARAAQRRFAQLEKNYKRSSESAREKVLEREKAESSDALYDREIETARVVRKMRSNIFRMPLLAHRAAIKEKEKEVQRMQSVLVELSEFNDSIGLSPYVPMSTFRGIAERAVGEATRRIKTVTDAALNDLASEITKRRSEVVDEKLLDAVSEQYIQSVVRPILDKQIESYKSLGERSYEYRQKYQAATAEGVMERALAIARRGLKLQNNHNWDDKEGEAAKQAWHQETNELPDALRSEVQRVMGASAPLENKLKSIVQSLATAPERARFSSLRESRQRVVKGIDSRLNPGLSHSLYYLQKARMSDDGEHWRRVSEGEKDSDDMWVGVNALKAVLATPALTQAFGSEYIEKAQAALREEAFSRMSEVRMDANQRVTAALRFFELAGPEDLPRLILTAYREIGSGGNRPFISHHEKSDENDLFQKVAAFGADARALVAEQDIPEALEIADLIKGNPEHWSNRHIFESDPEHPDVLKSRDNPVNIKIQEAVLNLCIRMYERDPEKMGSFTIDTVNEMYSDVEVPSKLRAILIQESAERQHLVPEVLEIAQRQISEGYPSGFTMHDSADFRYFANDPNSSRFAENFKKSIQSFVQYRLLKINSPETQADVRKEYVDGAVRFVEKCEKAGWLRGMLEGLDSVEILRATPEEFDATALLQSEWFTEAVAGAAPKMGDDLIHTFALRYARLGGEKDLAYMREVATSQPQEKLFNAKYALQSLIKGVFDEDPGFSLDPAYGGLTLEERKKLWDACIVGASGNGSENRFMAAALASAEYQTSGEKGNNFSAEIMKVADKLVASSDKVVLYFGLQLKRKVDSGFQGYAEKVLSLGDALTEIGKFDGQVLQSYAQLTESIWQQLDDQRRVATIKAMAAADSYRSLGGFFARFALAGEPSNEVTRIIGEHYPILHPQFTREVIVDNVAQKVTEQNWALLLAAYVQLESNQLNIPEVAESLKLLFSVRDNPETSEQCLGYLREGWQKFLVSPEAPLPLRVALVSQEISRAGGAGHLKYIESLAGLIHAVATGFRNPRIAQGTKELIKTGLVEFETRFRDGKKKERWSEDEKAAFYDLSTSIIEAAPSLYGDFLNVFRQMNPQQARAFASEQFPMYHTWLTLLQKPSQKEGEEVVVYDPKDLVLIRRSLADFVVRLGASGEESHQQVVAENKGRLVGILRERFAARFGVTAVPEQISPEHLRTIQDSIRYLSNMNNRTPEREAIMSLYLGLRLNGQWATFRSGGTIDPAMLVNGDVVGRLGNFIAQRAELDTVNSDRLGITAESLPAFKAALEEEVLSTIIGSVETVDVRIHNAMSNLEALADPDVYPDAEEKALLEALTKYGKAVGSALAKIYRGLAGQAVPLTPEEHSVRTLLAERAGDGAINTQEKVQALQKKMRPISAITSALGSLRASGINEQIDDLNALLVPSPRIVEIFRDKLGEEFTSASGALALSQDVDYLDNLVVKSGDKLNAEERGIVTGYMGEIRKRVQNLEGALDKVKESFVAIKRSVHDTATDQMKERLNGIERALFTKQTEQALLTRVTSNLDDIIENIRQCLGCMTREINNDTNLTFGDGNKFFVMSQTPGEPKSVSDQIVMLVPFVPSEGNPEMTFLFDTLYGVRTPDLLVGHVVAVFKKYSQLKRKFPEAKLSVMVSEAALLTAGISADVLRRKLLEEHELPVRAQEDNGVANITLSAAGDHYIEMGRPVGIDDMDSRRAGNRQVGGLRLTLG